MLRLLMTLGLATMLALAVGCSDDDNPAGPGNPNPSPFVDTTWFDNTSGVYRTQIDASSTTVPAYFSFGDGTSKSSGSWDLAFKRVNINLNGGFSSEGGGNVVGAKLEGINYDDIDASDTASLAWMQDRVNYAIGEDWLRYDTSSHQLTMSQYVYTMVDAEGDNYVKFRIDSLVGAGMPPSMGTVWISYYYQSTPNSKTLSGAIQKASIAVGSGTGYFDFSTGQAVAIPSQSTSTGWDLMFHSYNVGTNSGPNGPGKCATFPAWGELADPTDIVGLATHPSDPPPPMFPDFVESVFNGLITDDESQWYDYNDTTHVISARDLVFVLRIDDTTVYKMLIESYNANIGGSPVSGHYTFKWNKL